MSISSPRSVGTVDYSLNPFGSPTPDASPEGSPKAQDKVNPFKKHESSTEAKAGAIKEVATVGKVILIALKATAFFLAAAAAVVGAGF